MARARATGATRRLCATLGSALVLATGGMAQTPDPDVDWAAQPATIVRGNQNGGAEFVPQGVVALRDGHFEIQAELIADGRGLLQIKNALVEVVGNVRLLENGQITVEDATLRLKASRDREFDWFLQGGHLRTERARIGGNKIGYQVMHVGFWLNRGLWEATDTTVEYIFGILVGLVDGFHGDLLQSGGTLRAKRLSQGEQSDWVHLTGTGDVTLEDSTYPVAPSIRTSATQAVTVRWDCDSRNPVSAVYGDPSVHQGVTRAIAGSPWRLELRNTRVPNWAMHLDNVQNNNAPMQVVLDNAESVSCTIGGRSVVGRPTLNGDWSRYGNDLPGLPSTGAPGWHPIPAGASLSLANLTVAAGNVDAHVANWGLYFDGVGTDVTVSGPSAIAEIVMLDGRLTLDGGKDFGMGLTATVIDVRGSGVLQANDAIIGAFGQAYNVYPLITAFGRGRCTLNRVRTNNLTLMTVPENGSASAAITLTNAYTAGTLTTYPYPPGSINVVRATSDRNTDLQNLEFEDGVQPGGAPDYWSAAGVNGSAGAPRSSCASNNSRSFRFQTPGTSGSIWKSLSLPQGTSLEVFGYGNVQSAGAGQVLSLAVGVPGGGRQSATLSNAPGWQLLQVPPIIVGPVPGNTDVSFGNSSAGTSDVLLDRFRIHIANWWDDDNLLNLDFEDARYRHEGIFPTFWRSPDYWTLWRGQAQPSTSDLRPGTSGQRAARIVARDGLSVDLSKDLTFLLPGDQLTLTGWLKCIPVPGSTTNLAVLVGEGNRYNDQSYGNNLRIQIPVDSAWHSFTVRYTVPCPPLQLPFTRISVHCYGSPGNVVLADDFAVTIR